MPHYDSGAADRSLGGTVLTLPAWLLLLSGGIVSMGLGVLIVFLPPLVGALSPAYPNPTNVLGFASLFVATGAGLASGGLLVGFALIVRIVADRVRGRRAVVTRPQRTPEERPSGTEIESRGSDGDSG